MKTKSNFVQIDITIFLKSNHGAQDGRCFLTTNYKYNYFIFDIINMEPKIWGPPFWFMLHTISFSYPTNPTYHDQRHFYDFFQNLYHVIPCPECQQHYLKFLQTNPISPSLDSNKNLSKWVVDLHNSINTELSKPLQSYEDVATRYHSIYQNTTYKPEFIKGISKEETHVLLSSKNNLLQFVLILLLLSLIYLYLLK